MAILLNLVKKGGRRCLPIFRPLGFFILFYFFILYIFFDCKLLYLLCTLPRYTFTTMSIVYLFVSVVCLASTVIDRRQWLAEHRQKPTCLGHLF